MTGLQGRTVHPELGAVPFRLDYVSSIPDQQVEATIPRMRDYALLSALTPVIREQLMKAWAIGDGDFFAGIHRWVKSVLRFREDEDTVEQLDTPDHAETIEVLIPPMDLATAVESGIAPAEDCDGYAMYVASLLCAAGIPCNFVAVAADPADPSRFSHVYVAAYPSPDVRIPMDASHGEFAGWECPNRFGKRKEWPVQASQSFRFWPTMLVLAMLGGATYLAVRN
jgi:hypothetical protein